MPPTQIDSSALIWGAIIAALAPCLLIAVKWFFDQIEDKKQKKSMERLSEDTKAVRGELTKDSGESVKDKTNKGAEDSAKTLEVVQKIHESFHREIGELRSEFKTVLEKVGAVDAKVAHFDTELTEHKRKNEAWKNDLLRQLRLQEEQNTSHD